MGASFINVGILHYNNPKYFKASDFDFLIKKIWGSVLIGVTSLSDYCYIIDRYLVTNLKEPEVFGLYSSHGENIKEYILNRKKIGLIL